MLSNFIFSILVMGGEMSGNQSKERERHEQYLCRLEGGCN